MDISSDNIYDLTQIDEVESRMEYDKATFLNRNITSLIGGMSILEPKKECLFSQNSHDLIKEVNTLGFKEEYDYLFKL